VDRALVLYSWHLYFCRVSVFFFFFQAEDGIRDRTVTGVQTCALPISDTERYARFFREMLARGVFFAPSQFEAAFLSAAHTSENIDRTLAAAHEALQVMAAAEPAV